MPRDRIERARNLRNNMTSPEVLLWHYLRRNQLSGHRFRRQHPIGRYIADFACIEQRLIIELDGGQHTEQREYDRQRDAYISSRGYRILRFWNDDVLKDMDAVLEEILRTIETADGQTAPPAGELPRSG